MWPVLEVVANVPYLELYVTLLIIGSGIVPPFALNITVDVIRIHCAYRVCLEGLETVVPYSIFVPPDAEVNHPSNKCPVLLQSGRCP